MHWKIYFDGGASPNPGKGSCAYKAISEKAGRVLTRSWAMEGNDNTNNQAEWEAVVSGLESVLELEKEITVMEIVGDSQLVIEQLAGRYNVNSERLIKYHKRWLNLKDKYPNVTFTFKHVYREENTEMDNACKEAR